MKITALNGLHHKLNAEMGNIAGWEMPLFYTDAVEEHLHLRSHCGLTDFSCMGEIDIKGPDSTILLEKLMVNEIATAPVGKVVYTSMLNEDGIIIDDVTVYHLDDKHYMIVTSTATHNKAWNWIKEKAKKYEVYLTDVCAEYSLISIQGPKSKDVLKKVTNVNLDKLKYFWATRGEISNIPCLISRTGFTGELGYELYHSAYYANDLWNVLTDAGQPEQIWPIGLRCCVATLRLEKAYMMGSELTGSTPLELPISWAVKFNKDFIGKSVLLRQKKEGLKRKLVGFNVENGICKAGAKIIKDGLIDGVVTTAGYGPTVKKNICLGFVSYKFANLGEKFEVSDENKNLKLEVVSIPFYDPKGERLRT
jgi:aminomethyltransferase